MGDRVTAEELEKALAYYGQSDTGLFIKRLALEREELQRQYEWQAEQNANLKAELAQTREDTARLDFIEAHGLFRIQWHNDSPEWAVQSGPSLPDLREAIDASRAHGGISE